MAMVSTAVLTYLAAGLRDTSLLERFGARDIPGPLLAVPISLGMVVSWTMAGLIAGIVFAVAGLDDARPGLGSPALGFTVAMAALAVIPAALLLILWPRRWWLWSAMGASFAASFGWLMPMLATR